VLSGQVHEPQTIAYMIANCGNRDIVHAGTFFGDFLPALSRSLHPQALLWAFEPSRENYRCARITMEINSSSNVRLTHAGLGATRQQLFVATSDADGKPLGGGSHIVTEPSSSKNTVPVDIVAIDDVIPAARDVGILQLDVEGYEKEALSGALATIRRCKPILILEVLPQSDLEQSEWFSANILRLGYAKVTKLHANSVYSAAPLARGSTAELDAIHTRR